MIVDWPDPIPGVPVLALVARFQNLDPTKLGESDFGPRDTSRPGISWSAYIQYLLDTYATVAEAIAGEQDDHRQVVASPLPGSTAKPPTLHFSFSDAGDSAIFEHLDGKLVIHHGNGTG